MTTSEMIGQDQQTIKELTELNEQLSTKDVEYQTLSKLRDKGAVTHDDVYKVIREMDDLREQITVLKTKLALTASNKGSILDSLIEDYGIPKLDGTELGEAISSAVNSSLFDPMDVADVLVKEHRTIQQTSMKLALSIIERFAEVDLKTGTDGRNEAGVKVCKELMQMYQEKHGEGMRPRYLPHI